MYCQLIDLSDRKYELVGFGKTNTNVNCLSLPTRPLGYVKLTQYAIWLSYKKTPSLLAVSCLPASSLTGSDG